MSKALVQYRLRFEDDDEGQYITDYCSKIMECDDGMVTEDTLKRWQKELVESERAWIAILGFNKLD